MNTSSNRLDRADYRSDHVLERYHLHIIKAGRWADHRCCRVGLFA